MTSLDFSVDGEPSIWSQTLYDCLTWFPLSAASVMYLNSMSVTWTARIQIFLTVSKLLAIAIIIVPGMYQLFKGIISDTSLALHTYHHQNSECSGLHTVFSCTWFNMNPACHTHLLTACYRSSIYWCPHSRILEVEFLSSSQLQTLLYFKMLLI